MRQIFLSWMMLPMIAVLGCSSGEKDAVEPAAPEVEATSLADAIEFSFVFFGCNRVGWSPDYPTPSTANVAQLNQTFADIANLDPSPKYLFFLGDLVRNEEKDQGQTLEQQLDDWQPLWANGPLAGSSTQLIPMPGNHEVLASIESPAGSGNYVEIPNPPTYDVWLAWLSKNGYNPQAGNGPTPAGDPEDHLVADNSHLTWSFKAPLSTGGNAHFVLINTDTLTTSRSSNPACLQGAPEATAPMPGMIPAHWIEGDIQQANADADTDMIFAFGHKPIEAPGGSSDTSGRANILNCEEYPQADQLLTTFQANDKVVAYLAAHVHEWNHLDLGDPSGDRQLPQIIAGDAGSPLSGGDIFGFTLVTVYKNGQITATSYGRKAPDPYDNPDAGGPATPRTTVVLREAGSQT